jgi:hypothetical protein
MTRDETIALFLRGKEAWNAWAEKKFAERKALEAGGSQPSERGLFEDLANEHERGAWRDAAMADFSGCLFRLRGDKDIKVTAGEEKERGAGEEPRGKSIDIDGWQIDFQDFAFPGPSNFAGATFSCTANFRSTAFSDDVEFRGAAFSDKVNFERATFSGRTDFGSVAFSDYTDFRDAAFFGGAIFRGQTFTNDVFFNGAKFGPLSLADFGLATFERVVQFDDAVFEGEAEFNAVWGKRTFSLARARFKGVPDFIQAHFEEVPRLDNVVVEAPA